MCGVEIIRKAHAFVCGICSHLGMCTGTNTYMWRSEVNTGHLPSSLFSICFRYTDVLVAHGKGCS